jgi:DegV family protein with EDD domain
MIPLTFQFVGEENVYTDADVPAKEFYDRMREGGVAKTSAINPYTFEEYFAQILEEGKDVLYLSFSSGLSTTYNSSKMAAEELKERFPEQQVVTVDTLAASAGQGLIVYLVAQKQKEGATLEEVVAYAQSVAPKMCHWVTVDDLEYLKRGGRISPTVAFVGTVLGIKPIIHVDDEGHLVSVGKAKGRKAALNTLRKQLEETVIDKDAPVFISAADAIEDAELLKDMLETMSGVKVELITGIGPVIGSHAGPGTIALFFLGKER